MYSHLDATVSACVLQRAARAMLESIHHRQRADVASMLKAKRAERGAAHASTGGSTTPRSPSDGRAVGGSTARKDEALEAGSSLEDRQARLQRLIEAERERVAVLQAAWQAGQDGMPPSDAAEGWDDAVSKVSRVGVCIGCAWAG